MCIRCEYLHLYCVSIKMKQFFLKYFNKKRDLLDNCLKKCKNNLKKKSDFHMTRGQVGWFEKPVNTGVS